MKPGRQAILALAAVLVSGCGIGDPYNDERPPAPAKPIERSDERPRRAEPPAPLPRPATGGAPSPRAAVSLYARAFSNWTWRDVAEINGRVLAALSAGELRALVAQNARDLREDITLRRDRAANRGEQVAIDVQGSGPERTVWVVLRETASARGLSGDSDTRVTVYRARARRLGERRWYVTAFEPQG